MNYTHTHIYIYIYIHMHTAYIYLPDLAGIDRVVRCGEWIVRVALARPLQVFQTS